MGLNGTTLDGEAGWQQRFEHRHRLVLGAAIGFDQRARRRAETRAAHRIAQQIEQHRLELALRRRSRHGRAVGDEGVGDLAEVLHVRAEHDRLAEHRRLEHVVAAGGHEAAADEHDRADLVDRGQLADRVEHDDVGARLGVDGELACGGRSSSPRCGTAARLRRSARDGAAPAPAAPSATVARTRRNARSTAGSSPFIVLPATITGREGGRRK